MANIVRNPKSGSEWTINELLASNIQVVTEDVATFFGIPNLPQPSVSQAILVNENCPTGGLHDKTDRRFFNKMNHAMKFNPGEESAVDDFAVFLLEMLDYDDPNRAIRSRKDISLVVYGSYVHTQTDVCVMTEDSDILLVQEDKT